MQQNLWNIKYDLAVVLAGIGIGLDGDIVTEKLSIGPNATCLGDVTGGGLNMHNAFETDVSLTSNDYNLANGDNFSFNGTLFKMMTDTVATTSSKENPIYNLKGLSLYRSQRYEQSRAENGQFFFGPNAIILYGAASAVFDLFLGTGQPDYATVKATFGAVENETGGYDHVPERLPRSWSNRVTPYGLYDLGTEMHAGYLAHWKSLGQNDGPGNFTASELQFPQNGTVVELICFIYDFITGNLGVKPVPIERVRYITRKTNAHFKNVGCKVYNP